MNSILIENTIFLGYSPKVGTDLLWWLTYLFSAIAVFYFGFSFFFKGKLNFGTKSNKAKKKELTPMISQFLFMEENATAKEKHEILNLKIKIRELLKNKRNRKVLAKVIVELRQDLSGESLRLLLDLYKDLGLDKDAFTKLRNWKWFTVSQGIFELTRMEVAESYSKITKFINDRRGIIRKQAELSVVTLQDSGINYFLDTTDKKISEWQQLKMLDILIKKTTFVPPSFKNWLSSTNNDTILFCIRLIKYYKQFEAGPAIIKLIRHKNITIRSEAVLCAKEFMLIEGAETLKSVFLSSTNDCKLLIIDALEFFGREEDVEFLRLVKSSNEAFAVKNKAGSAVNNINPHTEIDSTNLESMSNDYLTKLLNDQETLETAKEDSVNTIKVVEDSLDDTTFVDDILQEIVIKDEDNDSLEIEKLEKNDMVISEELIEDAFEETTGSDIESSNEEEKDTTELLKFEIEEIKIKTPDPETTINTNIEASELEESTIPIDDIKHMEFVQYMSAKSLPKQENDEKTTNDENLYNELFIDKSHYEKFNLLEEIEENGDKYELSLLQAIITHEANKNIKDKAISIYEHIIGDNIEIENVDIDNIVLSEPVIFPAQTVFKDLYHSCDTEAKIILLEEIGGLGDSIELKFLKEELSVDKEVIRRKAAEVIATIENRIDGAANTTHRNITNTATKDQDIIEELANKKTYEFSSYNEKEQLIPLEYCFLLDELEIMPSKQSDNLNIDFDISDEYFLSTKS